MEKLLLVNKGLYIHFFFPLQISNFVVVGISLNMKLQSLLKYLENDCFEWSYYL